MHKIVFAAKVIGSPFACRNILDVAAIDAMSSYSELSLDLTPEHM